MNTTTTVHSWRTTVAQLLLLGLHGPKPKPSLISAGPSPSAGLYDRLKLDRLYLYPK